MWRGSEVDEGDAERPREKKKDKEIAEEKGCEREEDEDGMESENARN